MEEKMQEEENMLTINKLQSNHVVDFAAEELHKYQLEREAQAKA